MSESKRKEMAGNWHKFSCFVWNRGYDLEDADNWMIWYTSGRDARPPGSEQPQRRLPNCSIHSRTATTLTWLPSPIRIGRSVPLSVGRFVFTAKTAKSLTPFEPIATSRIGWKATPHLNEADYSEREYNATLENYRSEMWDMEKQLPEGWASEVYSWFSDNGHDRYTENRDDGDGYAPQEAIVEALSDLGMLPTLILAAKPA